MESSERIERRTMAKFPPDWKLLEVDNEGGRRFSRRRPRPFPWLWATLAAILALGGFAGAAAAWSSLLAAPGSVRVLGAAFASFGAAIYGAGGVGFALYDRFFGGDVIEWWHRPEK